jgi:hypothetical protein
MIFFARDAATRSSAELQKEGFKVAAPFSTIPHALMFAALILSLALAPYVVNQWLPGRAETIFKGIPLSYGNYYTVGHEIARGGEIDVLILGASDGWTGIDPEIVAEELARSLGRPARVLNFSTNWAGEERFVQIVHDLTASGVRAHVVLGFENDALQNIPHELSKFWWRGATSTTGLLAETKAQFYMMQLLGLPRQMWSRLLMGKDRPMMPAYRAYADRMIAARGFNGEQLGWKSHHEPNEANRRKLPQIEPPAPALDPASFEFKGVEDANFRFQRYTYSPLQSHFFRQVSALVKAQGGVYASVALPTHFADEPLDRVIVRELYDGQPRDWPVLGIAQTAMFSGMTFDEMKDYYTNESHLNRIGARAFTRAIMPAIKKLHDQASVR